MLEPRAGSETDPPTSTDTSKATETIETQLWKGIRFLASGRTALARRQFQDILERVPTHVTARTQLARCHLAERNVELAAREAEAVLAQAPDHVPALCIAAECALVMGEDQKARAIADRAIRALHHGGAHGPARHDLVDLVHVLAALEDDWSLERLARRYVRGSVADWDGVTLARLGVAAWNMGRRREARWMWRRAEQDPFLENLIPIFLHAVDLVEDGAVPAFRMDYRLGTPQDGEEEGEASGSLRAFALYTLWQGEDTAAREAALDLLAQAEAPWAEPFLYMFLLRPEIPDPLKLRASGWLLERGFLRPNVPVHMHLEGDVREVTIETAPRPVQPVSLELVENSSRNRPARAWNSRKRSSRSSGVHPGMAWEAGLETLLKDQLMDIARALGIAGVSRLRKRELAGKIAGWLRDNWDQVLGTLAREDVELLRWIAEQGGVVPLARLRERMEGQPAAAPGDADEDDGAPAASDERLQRLGLLFIGRMGEGGRGQQVAVIPREMREDIVNGW